MIERKHRPIAFVLTVSVLVLGVLGVGVSAGGARRPMVVDPAQPPRPTLTSTPSAMPSGAASIELHAQFGQNPPLTTSQLSALWTVVQWQDGSGNWFDVAGWQGPFDELNDTWGLKVWGVNADRFGQGPFRWLVTNQQEGGAVLATSQTFYLPNAAGIVTVVTVAMDWTPYLALLPETGDAWAAWPWFLFGGLLVLASGFLVVRQRRLLK